MLWWFDLISLLMTPFVFFACIVVLWHYGPTAWKALTNGKGASWEWLIVGIVIGFAGSLLNNVYWAPAWTKRVFDGDLNWWIERGAIANLLVRQLPLLAAAAFHIYAASHGHKSLGRTKIIVSAILAVVLTLVSVAIAFPW